MMSPTGPGGIPDKEKGYKVSTRDTPGGGKVEFRLPLSYCEDEQQYDVLEYIRTCAKPKLFIVGIHDTTVPQETVRTAFEQAAEPKQL